MSFCHKLLTVFFLSRSNIVIYMLVLLKIVFNVSRFKPLILLTRFSRCPLLTGNHTSGFCDQSCGCQFLDLGLSFHQIPLFYLCSFSLQYIRIMNCGQRIPNKVISKNSIVNILILQYYHNCSVYLCWSCDWLCILHNLHR